MHSRRLVVSWIFSSQFTFFNPSEFHKMSLQASFQRFIAMDWYGQSGWISLLHEDVMAAGHSTQYPSAFFE